MLVMFVFHSSNFQVTQVFYRQAANGSLFWKTHENSYEQTEKILK